MPANTVKFILTAGKRPATAETGVSVASSPQIKVRVLCQRMAFIAYLLYSYRTNTEELEEG
ncbi:MAG: hypothetical protein CVV49_08960 [Spirochaetae bacterium HGW-Spirochaetae-5]|nr:MAG: hypothetical protein CVV49_08960 [Spirochaetae bacterium HGW-Spirochaetae-5]